MCKDRLYHLQCSCTRKRQAMFFIFNSSQPWVNFLAHTHMDFYSVACHLGFSTCCLILCVLPVAFHRFLFRRQPSTVCSVASLLESSSGQTQVPRARSFSRAWHLCWDRDVHPDRWVATECRGRSGFPVSLIPNPLNPSINFWRIIEGPKLWRIFWCWCQWPSLVKSVCY